jgi:hypothetical protein
LKTLGPRSYHYVDQIVPQLIRITEVCQKEHREFFLKQFGLLASLIRHHLKPYMKSIFELIRVSLL